MTWSACFSAAAASTLSHRDQDVVRMALLGRDVAVLVLVVVVLQVGIGHVIRARDLREGQLRVLQVHRLGVMKWAWWAS